MEVYKPLVSVIIPTYNRPNYLKQTLKSVVNQTYTNIEILVIDDGSKMNYAESICNKHPNCKYFYKTNGGLSSARNFGIKKAKGEYIAFLDDDDFWREDKLQKQVEFLNSNLDIDLVHSSAMIVDENGTSTGIIIGASPNKIHKRSGYVFWNALGVWVVKSPTPLIRKEAFKSGLMFDESIKVGEDLDFYQRLFYRHKVYYINEPLAFYREYKNEERLSLQKIKYIGIEYKMLKNFKKMGIKNLIINYRIAYLLLKSALRRWNLVHPENKIQFNLFDKYLTPTKTLSKLV
ncbi:MAG: glycosyltransferase [Lutibacter sp.]|uniref:glycosyltransferase family 2 protein n=1 Tax=Lutibacter sp. TaxID=1925666 RepID=UPI00385A3325